MYNVGRTRYVEKKCGYLKLRYGKEVLYISLQEFQCQFMQTELFLAVKQTFLSTGCSQLMHIATPQSLSCALSFTGHEYTGGRERS